MQSKEKAQTYLALKQAKEMALQLLHRIAAYWFWQKKKNDGHTGFGLFPLLLPVFFSSLFPSFSVLLSFSFCSLFTVTDRISGSLCFYLHVFGCFSALFSLFFLFFFCSLFAILSSFLPLSQVIKGAYIQSNISLFRKDSMH